MPYQSLDPQKVVKTLEALCCRIEERFPQAGLVRIAQKLCEIGRTAQERSVWISRPLLVLRIATVLLVLLIISVVIFGVFFAAKPAAGLSLVDLIQVLEAGTNDIILIGAAIFSLITLETRIKRRRILQAIHELRVIAHIVDMHQLTKDPEGLLNRGPATLSSPTAHRMMTPFELGRYLDYCTELLSLCGKIAVLYVQNFSDPLAVAAVNEIETLTTDLSRKIWQKLVILHSMPS